MFDLSFRPAGVLLLLLLFLLSGPRAMAQQRECSTILQGQVFQSGTGEPLPFATIAVENSSIGTIADENGRFRLDSLCADQVYTIVCSHISCDHQVHTVTTAGTVVEQDFYLEDRPHDLGGIIVAGAALAPQVMENSESAAAGDLGAARGLSLARALEHLPGVNTFQTGSTVAKPVIQGLRGNRVLLFNNGVRLDGQQWGDDHAPEIDPFSAEEVTVVKGAASVRYGAGALGGVVLMEPASLPVEKSIGGKLHLGGYSNGRTGLVSGVLEGRLGNRLPLQWRVSGTAKRGGNIRTPDYYLENTGLSEYRIGYTLGWAADRWELAFDYSDLGARTGIFAGSHIGNLTDLRLAIERGRPIEDGAFSYRIGRPQQKVNHETAQLKGEYRFREAGKLKWQLSRQFNRRQEFDAHRAFGEVPDETGEASIELELTSYQAELRYEHARLGNWRGEMGVQLNQQRHTTDRGSLLPDYRSLNGGVYLIERWRRYPQPWEIELGLRYDYMENRLDRNPTDPMRYQSVSGTAGLLYHAGEKLDLRLHAGTAWRPPHPSELYSDGLHHGSASYETGRPDLQSERAAQLSAGWEWEPLPGLEWRLSSFYQLIDNFIFLEPQDEPVLTIRGAFPAFRYEQADARLFGMDTDAHWRWHPRWETKLIYSLVRGRNRTVGEPLFYLPADKLRAGLTFYPGAVPDEGESGTFISLEAARTFRQTRIPENRDFAPAPPAYTLLDLSAGTTFRLAGQPIRASITAFNLLNVRYRDYLDRFRYFAEAPGRNIALQLTIDFGR